jgi:hypothetical protein
MPVYLDQREPELEDPSEKLDDHHWQPASNITTKLTRCLEAIRDVSTGVAPLSDSAHPEKEKRTIKNVITPIYSLATAIRDLFNDLQSNCFTKLDPKHQRYLTRAFRNFGQNVPTNKGNLKTARDKIAAHLDKDSWTTDYRQFWDSFSIEDVFAWIRGCIKMLDVLLEPDVYSWTRNSGYSNVYILMNVDGRECSFLLDDDGNAKSFCGFQFVKSPKWGIAREARELWDNCADLCRRLGINQGTTWKLNEAEDTATDSEAASDGAGVD